ASCSAFSAAASRFSAACLAFSAATLPLLASRSAFSAASLLPSASCLVFSAATLHLLASCSAFSAASLHFSATSFALLAATWSVAPVFAGLLFLIWGNETFLSILPFFAFDFTFFVITGRFIGASLMSGQSRGWPRTRSGHGR